MQADQCYLIRGASTANSPFFERTRDCKLFLALADRFFADYLTISRFQNNKDGWVMIVITKSSQEIKAAYYARRALSNKCKKEHEYKEVWQMLSDQVRIFLSTYVKATNHRTGRKGGKVRCRFERFLFDTEEEALAFQEYLEQEYYEQAQPLKRYRPSKKLCRLRRQMVRTSIYMGCYLLRTLEKAGELGMRCLDLDGLAKFIARQHTPPPSNPNSSP